MRTGLKVEWSTDNISSMLHHNVQHSEKTAGVESCPGSISIAESSSDVYS